ncbi:hypothetical protein A2954_03450 [Candidatus Roizmanbacteria bacterium RIFCSPLOWO2_01_FULL_37_12]|uniref:Uncharacterized protein n=1 Tax=Candidatus Roizmanbacteria bacterium RIFCSPLOWO2_01_FULL_37_12 TaxID=1802056 RepID=A0A1F7IF87_9BACT|nr:MAG: hypothetical protein A3D76_01315 [Candidatus Roizmanbacteria bacterium RIFCSPHIGHO2_02_FULL_37_9b]OGK42022.1 MAG: hypothetical protein A2954_03450 [Candidatus Roizmanbacteria bacterium RIFCSPLOWO2_01_FULL_37_12]
MIKSSYLSYLLSLIKTKTYAEEVINNLDELKDALYNRRVDLDKRMGELFSFEMKEKIKSYSWQEQVNLNDPESFGKFLTDLRGHIKKMSVVTIKIAFSPDGEIINEVSGWFVENYGKNVLIDLVYDENIIAGAVIKFNETEKDFSLKKKIDEKYKAEDWKMFINQVRKSKQIEQKAEDGSQKTDKSDGLSNSLPEFHSPSSGLSG